MRSRRSAALAGVLLIAVTAWGPSSASAEGGDEVCPSWTVVSELELEAMRGGDDDSDVRIRQENAINVTLTGNVVGDGAQGGPISVGDTAFSQAQGIQSTMINSGHNVSMSSLINVVVDLSQ